MVGRITFLHFGPCQDDFFQVFSVVSRAVHMPWDSKSCPRKFWDYLKKGVGFQWDYLKKVVGF